MTRMPSSSIHLLVNRPSRNHDSNNLHPPSCNNQICDQTFPGISWVGAAMVNQRPQCNWSGKRVFLGISLLCFIGSNGTQENVSSSVLA